MKLKEKFILALKGENATDIEEADTLTIQQMREMLSEGDKEHIRNIISEYEQKQIDKFVKQLKIISNGCITRCKCLSCCKRCKTQAKMI